MQPIRRAVIDIGTNSVKLLVADVAGHEIRPICEQSKQTRLGHGFYETHRLQADAIDSTAKAVLAFAAVAREAQAVSVRVLATSAAREAVNRQELVTAVEQTSGLKVEVISGDEEADLGYQGVTTDPQLEKAPVLLMDVGGGSTQFVFGRDGQAQFRHSFPLGAVRLMETIPCSDPPRRAELAACRQWLRAFLQREVQPKMPAQIEGAAAEAEADQRLLREAATGPAARVRLVGVGGTASILACMETELTTFDRARIEATRLSAARVSWHLERLWSLPLDERKNIFGLPKNRADIIVMGVAVYQVVMETFEFPELQVSTRGLRFAALLQETAAARP